MAANADLPNHQGPWKEGRLCAASLLYLNPRPDQAAWIAEHHAAVGIRASIQGAPPAISETLALRNWDLRDPGTALPKKSDPNLPQPRTEHDPATIQTLIAAAKPTGEWLIWEFTPETLDHLGPAGHKALLQWLGDEHARVWCAPIKDIAARNADHPTAPTCRG